MARWTPGRQVPRIALILCLPMLMAGPGTAKELDLPPRALVRLGTDSLRTRVFITGVAFSPDARLIAAAEANTRSPRISLFSVPTGRLVKEIRLPEKHEGWVNCLAISPDGTRLLWGEVSGQVALFDLQTDRLLFREKVHGGGGIVNGMIVDMAAYSGTVNEVAFSPDGTIMASAGIDGAVHLRRVDKPTEVVRDFKTDWSPTGHPNRMAGGLGPMPGPRSGLASASCLAFSPDGKQLVVGSASDATILIWRIKDGLLVAKIPGAHGDREGKLSAGVMSLAVTPDNRRILSAGRCDLPTAKTSLAGLPLFVVGVTLSEVRLWDLDSGERIRDLTGNDHQGPGYAALSADGERVAEACREELRLVETQTGRVVASIPLSSERAGRPAFSRDGSLVALPLDNAIALFDAKTGRRFHHDEATPIGESTSAGWSASGTRIATVHRDGIVRVWEAATGKLVWSHDLAGPMGLPERAMPLSFVTFSADDRRVIVGGGKYFTEGMVAIFEAARGLPVRTIRLPEVNGAALSPDRKTLVVSAAHIELRAVSLSRLYGIEVESGRTVWAMPPKGEQTAIQDLRLMRFGPDSASIDVFQASGVLTRYDARTGKQVRRLSMEWHPPAAAPNGPRRRLVQPFWQCALSRDGFTLAAVVGNTIGLWNFETGKIRSTLAYPDQKRCHLALSPDGKTLATSIQYYLEDPSEDPITLYELERGRRVLSLEPSDDRAVLLAFSPDGQRLLTAFHRGSALIWDVRR